MPAFDPKVTSRILHHETVSDAARRILECWFEKRPIRPEYYRSGTGAHSYCAGDATKGSEEAARDKRA
jgi:hypothetical protein